MFLLSLFVFSLVLLDSDITILFKVPPSVGVRKGSIVKFGWKKTYLHRYSNTNVMYFLFSLLRIKGNCVFHYLLSNKVESVKHNTCNCIKMWVGLATCFGLARGHHQAIHYRTTDQEKIHETLAYMGSHAALQMFIIKHTKPVYGCKSLRQVDRIGGIEYWTIRWALSSGGAAQTAFGVLPACYVSWLHQEWSETGVGDTSSTPVLVQPTNITRTQYTKCRLCSASWGWASNARNILRPLILNKLNKKCITLVSLDWYTMMHGQQNIKCDLYPFSRSQFTLITKRMNECRFYSFSCNFVIGSKCIFCE
jgi:hypothetical protein